MVIFWIVLASGVTVVLGEQAGFPPGGKLALVSRTVFWCSAVAYFATRLYQFVVRRTRQESDLGQESDTPEN
jgi:hypothetical protein